MAKCCVCETELRDDKAFMDADWGQYNTKKGKKTICRDCEKIISQSVVNSY